jgi:hypothetical protein
MSSIEEEKQYLANAEASGLVSRLGAYFKLSGPGWLQSAITLGGGSLAASLFLGVLAGYSLLWLQPVAIILGVIMLCAISHVTLTTGQSPFVSINSEINPVLGWGWAIATIMANIVWCLPQFSLGTAAVTQNLIPELNNTGGKVGVCIVLLTLAILVVWAYDRGSKGVKIFDLVLKIMVGLVVLSFFGVVAKMAFSGELEWKEIGKGFIPDLSLISEPADVYEPRLEKTGEFRSFWEGKVVSLQRDVMITAAATAVGINMTFFMPFVLLRRRWGREHRGLAKFDLWTALLIPYVVATSCVVIAAGSQFNNKPLSAYKAEDIHSLVTKAKSMKPGDSVYNALTNKLGIVVQDVGKGQFEFKGADQNTTIVSADHLVKRMLKPGDSVYNALSKKPGIVIEDVGEGQLKIEEADQNTTITISAGHLVKRVLDPGDFVYNSHTKKPGIVVRNVGEGQLEIADVDKNTTMTAKSLHLVKRVLHDNLVKDFDSLISGRLANEHQGYENKSKAEKKEILKTVPVADKYMAAMLVKRDSFNLAASLEGLLGSKAFSHYVFGIGVVGMALSTIIILMTINGHAVCEVLGKPHKGPVFLAGALVAGLGVVGPFAWGAESKFWLAVPTSILGFTLIPVAYLSFFLLINSKKVLGKNRPTGKGRFIWNAGLLVALAVMGSAAFLTAWNKTWGDIPFGRYALIGFGIMLIIGHFHLKHAKLAAKLNALDLKQQKLEKEQE